MGAERESESTHRRKGRTADREQPPRLKIADIAAHTHLSVATVSRAINDRPRVAPETRARVLAALDELSYVPSAVAASLRTGRTRQLGLVIDAPHDPVRLATMQGAFAAATGAHYGMVVYLTSEHGEHGHTYGQTLARGWVDGALLLWPRRSDEPLVGRLRADGLPVVLIEPEAPIAGVPAIYADAYSDGYRSTRYLLDLGHRRIAACANPDDWGIEGRYLDGYRAALAEAGLPDDPSLAVAAGWSYEAGYETVRRWLQAPDPPTGMCFRVDMAALGAVAAARDLDVGVPENLSVIGGDDTQMTSWIKPALTTLRERRAGVARAACEMLLAVLDGRDAPADPVLVEAELVIRQSTAAR